MEAEIVGHGLSQNACCQVQEVQGRLRGSEDIQLSSPHHWSFAHHLTGSWKPATYMLVL